MDHSIHQGTNMLRYIMATIMVSSVFCLPAFGWGKTGHRVTGEIAEAYLDDHSKSRIQEILGVEDLAEASTWPDFMRSSPTDYWQRTANPWHYVTVPEGSTYPDVEVPEWGDAATALASFRETLMSETASIDEQALALRFTIHIIGDLHQPQHITGRRQLTNAIAHEVPMIPALGRVSSSALWPHWRQYASHSARNWFCWVFSSRALRSRS